MAGHCDRAFVQLRKIELGLLPAKELGEETAARRSRRVTRADLTFSKAVERVINVLSTS